MDNANTAAKFETLGVLAGAYRGGIKAMLTHTIAVDSATGKALCRQGNIADHYSSSDAERALAPTCTRCLAKDPRFNQK